MEYFFNFDKLGYLSGPKGDGCILCRMAEERARNDSDKALLVHQSPSFVVCVNLYPYNPGHLMIFPRRHVGDIRELGREERASLDDLTDRCLSALDAVYHPAAYNVGFNMGVAAGASIPHLHEHVIPRYEHEIGIAELMGGARVLVEDPRTSAERIRKAFTPPESA